MQVHTVRPSWLRVGKPCAGTIAGLILLLGAGASPAAAGGDSVVNSTLDLPDADLLDGVADADLTTEGLQTTLRAALQHANATPGADTILLPEGVFKLTIKGSAEDASATGDLDVTDVVTITGAGNTLTIIDGKKAKDRVIDVAAGVSCAINQLTIRGGNAAQDSESGGGVRALEDATLVMDDVIVTKCKSMDDGAGLALQGANVTITDTLISKNKAKDDGGGLDLDASGFGGTLSLDRVTFSGNKAKDEGGAMENSGAVATITNCTFSGNKATEEGGALSLEDGSTTTLLSCTLAKNKAPEGSGISEDENEGGPGVDVPDVINVGHTIVSNKATTNFAGSDLTSNGHNLDSGDTCGFNGTGDLEDQDARLLKLADNGGATPTMALKPDSPALDAGDDALAPPLDQRGLPRVDLPGVGAGGVLADIGAFELQEL